MMSSPQHRYRAQTCRELCERIDELLDDPRCRRAGCGAGRRVAARPGPRLCRPLRRRTGAARWPRWSWPTRRPAPLKSGAPAHRVLGLRAFALDVAARRRGSCAKRWTWPTPMACAGYCRCPSGPGRLGAPGCRAAAGAAHRMSHVPEPWCRQAGAGARPVGARQRPGHGAHAQGARGAGTVGAQPSNKEIGRALQAGETTVKWHVKNLFAKLDAGTRKQVVLRARILGLLQPA